VFLIGSNFKLLYSEANLELKNIDNWMITNKLSINIQKTVHILFKIATQPTNKSAGSLTLTLRNEPIKNVCFTRFLGVIISNDLSWKEHMQMLKRKLRAIISNVIRVSSYSKIASLPLPYMYSNL